MGKTSYRENNVTRLTYLKHIVVSTDSQERTLMLAMSNGTRCEGRRRTGRLDELKRETNLYVHQLACRADKGKNRGKMITRDKMTRWSDSAGNIISEHYFWTYTRFLTSWSSMSLSEIILAIGADIIVSRCTQQMLGPAGYFRYTWRTWIRLLNDEENKPKNTIHYWDR